MKLFAMLVALILSVSAVSAEEVKPVCLCKREADTRISLSLMSAMIGALETRIIALEAKLAKLERFNGIQGDYEPLKK